MNRIIVFIVVFLICSCSQQTVNHESNNGKNTDTSKQKPNLVLIIADDLSWDDVGVYGHPTIRTPNIDKLANQGMRFDNAFLTTNSCSPSRASIITGKYPHMTNAEQLHWPLPVENITFVEKLREQGYWTAQAGKWHMGKAIEKRFDLILPEDTSGFVYQAGKDKKTDLETTVNDGSGAQKWEQALSARPNDKPFFLWLAAVDPHRPYFPETIDEPHTLEEVRLPPYFPDTPEVRQDFARYYDEVTRMDKYIGLFMDKLKQQGLEENTLVLFIADNGRAFPRDKTTLYDGGIKTPWIVHWPAGVKAGSTTAELVSSVDIARTFLKLAEAEVGNNFLGQDFSTLFNSPYKSITDYVYAEDHWHDFEDYSRAVRDKNYKYIKNFYTDIANTPSADALRSDTFQTMLVMHREGKLNEAQLACFNKPRAEEELYDIITDPYELNNLAADPEYKKVLAKMRQRMNETREATQDFLPAKRTPDEFDRDSGEPNHHRIRPRPSKKQMQERGII